jgi:hypothetical protein
MTAGTRLLEHECWNTTAGTRLLEHECWNTNAGTRLLEHECLNTTVGTRMLEHECWNTALHDEACVEEASKEPFQKIKDNAGMRKAEERIKRKGNYSWS